MYFYKTTTKTSAIAKDGVFAAEPIERGAIIGIFAYDLRPGFATRLMTEAQYHVAQHDGRDEILRTAVRWVGDYFMYCDQTGDDEDFINHSAAPNMLYHCGILFALRAIAPGEELTVDYRFIFAANDRLAFMDDKTGARVDGVSGRQALLESCRQLLELYADSGMPPARHSDFAPLAR